MAGSNQAVNLSGMLSQMGNMFGRRIDATPFTNAMQGAVAPEVDNNDPASLENYAQYLERFGKTQEAAQYRQRAGQLAREKQQANAMKGLFSSASQGAASAAQGHVAGLNQAISKVNQQAQNMDNPEALRFAAQQRQRLEAMREPAEQRSVQNNVQAVSKINTALEREDVPTQAKEALKERQKQLLENPQVADAYVKQSAERVRAEVQQKKNEEFLKLQEMRKPFNDAWGTEGYEEWKETQVAAGKGAAVDALESSRIQMETDKARLEDIRSSQSATPDTTLVTSLKERLSAGGLNIPEQQASALSAQIVRLEEELKDAEGMPRFRRSQIADQLKGIAALVNNASYSRDAGNAAAVQAIDRSIMSIDRDIATVSDIPAVTIRERAMELLGTSDSDDIFEKDGLNANELAALGIVPPEDYNETTWTGASAFSMSAREAARILLQRERTAPLVQRRSQLVSERDDLLSGSLSNTSEGGEKTYEQLMLEWLDKQEGAGNES